ncbi:MAG: hypothetical protein WC755_01085 [Candidatus Woesearchaeota archaeon]|jgi:hypothetical protein
MAKKKVSKNIVKKVVKKISKKSKGRKIISKQSKSKKVDSRTVVRKEFKAAKQKLIVAEKDYHKAVKKNPKATKLILAGIGAAIAAGITIAVIKHKNKRKPLFK